MPEAYRPGLPVLSDEERLRRNAIQQEWSKPFEDVISVERPSMAALYEDEPSTDEILAKAKAHLAESAPMDRMIKGAGEIARRGITSGPQSTEMHAPEPEYGYGDIARDAVVGASIPASFLPGPIGMAAGAVQGINALATGDTVGAGFAALPAIRALKGAGAARSMGPIPKTGAEIGAKVSYPRAQATSMQMAGELPSPVSSVPRYRVRDVPVEGPQPYVPNEDDKWLAQQIAAFKQRIGLVDDAPSSAAPNGPKVRALSEGEEQGIEDLGQLIDDIHGPDAVLGPGGRYVSPPDDTGIGRVIQATFGNNPPPSVSRQTARAAVELSDADRAMLREGGAIFRGKKANDHLEDWVNAGKGVDGPIPFPGKPEYDIQGMPATDWNKTMFGGATSSTEGTFGQFVRPKERTPIGKRPARRGEGDDAIIWNPR